ncbi:DUF2059 domain-containing protein [Oligoflexus tunisiensis]|uniref:DUF2059 domain-containing protein n=1 Tax=Oligoflexus tunisiensis TaxID=708132 RepID=UPI000A54C971|nr:DUF2059 domain-containing protein [Oligoflexus tunisiensis]
MNRKSALFRNLALLFSFAAGYAVAALMAVTADKLTETPAPVTITQPAATEDTTSTKEPAPAPVATQDTSDVAALQAQLAEKTAKISELERKLAAPTHENVHPDDDTPEYREKLAADLLEVTRTKDMIQQAFQASSQMVSKELTPEGQEALNQAISKIYGWDKMEKVFTKVYTDVFSAQELNDLSEFYRSDVGAAMLKKQPEVMQKTMQLVQQINQEAQPKLMAEMDAIMKKHRLKTASKPESTPTKN